MISAILHQRAGPSVSEDALDLRPAELAILVPLVALLLFLSAWPAAVSDRVTANVLDGKALAGWATYTPLAESGTEQK